MNDCTIIIHTVAYQAVDIPFGIKSVYITLCSNSNEVLTQILSLSQLFRQTFILLSRISVITAVFSTKTIYAVSFSYYQLQSNKLLLMHLCLKSFITFFPLENIEQVFQVVCIFFSVFRHFNQNDCCKGAAIQNDNPILLVIIKKKK